MTNIIGSKVKFKENSSEIEAEIVAITVLNDIPVFLLLKDDGSFIYATPIACKLIK